MGDAIKICSMDISRRTLLQGAAIAGLAPVLAMNANPTMAAGSKVSKVSVAYQDKPHDSQTCAGCGIFEPPSACKSVEGVIAPNGWCKIWVKKSA